MHITSCKFFNFNLPLTKPFPLKGAANLHSRTGIIVQLQDDQSNVGWGEISPLQGFSRESVQAIIQQVGRLQESLIGAVRLNTTGLFPSVACGVELAFEDLVSKREDKPLFSKLAKKQRNIVFVNRLLLGSDDEILKDAREALDEGYRSVKLKIGHRSSKLDVALIRKLYEIFEDRVAIRLDANRSLSIEQAVSFGKAISDCNIEYIEEPVESGENRKAFYEKTGIPMALDETLASAQQIDLKTERGVHAVILKPMLLGGYQRAFQMATEAKSAGIKSVVTSVLETGIGTRGLALFAAMLPTSSLAEENTAMGLDIYRCLKTDLLAPRIKIDEGKIIVSTLKEPHEVIMSALEEIN